MDKNDNWDPNFPRPEDWTDFDENAVQALYRAAVHKREADRERNLKKLRHLMGMNKHSLT